ncbi:hypothetical protein Y032_0023g698 [Ancylostoma ceylanicum]|uniref:Uncharacterized protein n=1 Tax=Ancylostoma ceylanicum TaxID=53326 RepID=A0A016UWE6_9BILA|nr:hypothetical protein Y032_0023g698 [Ancylostoma ceylanicum]
MLLLAVHEVVISLYWPTFRRLRLRQSLKESNRFVKVFGQTPPQLYTDPDYARKSRITRAVTLTSSQVRRPIEVLDDGRTRWTWKQYETFCHQSYLELDVTQCEIWIELTGYGGALLFAVHFWVLGMNPKSLKSLAC